MCLNNLEKLENEKLKQTDIADISFLESCKELQTLFIRFTQITNLPVKNLDKLKEIRIVKCNSLPNIDNVEYCTGLEMIVINGLVITSIEVFCKLKKLKMISIVDCNQITDYNILGQCNELEEDYLDQLNITSISFLRNLKKLKNVYIYDCNSIVDFDVLNNIDLEELGLFQLKLSSLDFLTSTKNLKVLQLENMVNITDVGIIRNCPEVEKIVIANTLIKSFSMSDYMFKLKELNIQNCAKLQRVRGFRNCPNVETIIIICLNITSIAVFKNLKNLKKVHIYKCKHITDYDVLEGCAGLTDLCIKQTNISDISPIANLNNLETLELTGNNQFPKQFKKQIKDNKDEILQFLKDWRQTDQYKRYNKTQIENRRQQQENHQLRAGLREAQLNFQQFRNNINNQIRQNKINLVKTMKLIIWFQI